MVGVKNASAPSLRPIRRKTEEIESRPHKFSRSSDRLRVCTLSSHWLLVISTFPFDWFRYIVWFLFYDTQPNCQMSNASTFICNRIQNWIGIDHFRVFLNLHFQNGAKCKSFLTKMSCIRTRTKETFYYQKLCSYRRFKTKMQKWPFGFIAFICLTETQS